MKRLSTLATLALLASVTQHALAGTPATAYDNLGPAPYNVDGYSTYGLIDGARTDRAEQFTASSSLILTTLSLGIGQAYWDGTTLSGTATVQILTDSSNAPGTLLQSWTTPSQSNISGNLVALTSASPTVLTAGTKYWIKLSAPTSSNLGGAWFFADDNHTGTTLTDWINDTTGTPTFSTLTRGFRAQVAGNVLYPGDANYDGSVNISDLNIVAADWQKKSQTWTTGDFNNDGLVNIADLNILAANWQAGTGSGSSSDSLTPNIPTTPEPSSLILLSLATLPLLRKRR